MRLIYCFNAYNCFNSAFILFYLKGKVRLFFSTWTFFSLFFFFSLTRRSLGPVWVDSLSLSIYASSLHGCTSVELNWSGQYKYGLLWGLICPKLLNFTTFLLPLDLQTPRKTSSFSSRPIWALNNKIIIKLWRFCCALPQEYQSVFYHGRFVSFLLLLYC